MRIFRHYAEFPASLRGGVVAIGNFDGVHLGHQAVMKAALVRARADGVAAGVMTFEPHPRSLFRPDGPAFRLTPLRTKTRLIEGLGIDFLLMQHFDRSFSAISAGDFVRDVLADGLGLSHVVVGHDFAFGHDRAGSLATLTSMASGCGFSVEVLEPVADREGLVYSSTRVRDALVAGHPAEAARVLGRDWEIEGRVQHGDKRGRQLGFPTANLTLDDHLAPAAGVYAVMAGLWGKSGLEWRAGVANFGTRPTVGGAIARLETHIFDFDGDLYGTHLSVALVEYLRPERSFPDLGALKTQIEEDSARARRLLADRPAPSTGKAR